MTSQSCVECGRRFAYAQQFVYRNGWTEAPICRARGRCQERKGHTFRPCRLYTDEGLLIRCGYVGCGDDTHRVRAELAGTR
jgi:hypothetical protein